MKKAWRIIILVVLVAVLLGAVCVGVGFLTGGDMSRIYTVLDNRYHLDAYVQYFRQLYAAFLEAGVF